MPQKMLAHDLRFLVSEDFEMLTKVYFALWALIVLAAIGFFVTGNLTPMVEVVFGFIAFGMVFMGIISVLPTSVHETLVKH